MHTAVPRKTPPRAWPNWDGMLFRIGKPHQGQVGMFCVRSYLGPRETTPVGDDLDYEHAGAVLLDNAGLGDPPHADIFRFELCGSPPRRAPAGSHSKSAFKGSCPVFCIRCVSPGDGEGKYIRAIDDGPGPLFFACGKTSRRAAEFCFLPAARSDHFEMIYLDPRGIQERGYPMGVIGDCLGQYDDCGGPPLQVVMFPVLPDEFCPDAARLEVAAQRTSDKEKLELQNAEAAAAALVTPELLARVLAQRPAPRDAVSAAGGAAGAAAGEDARTANARRKRARQRYWRLVLRDLRVSAMTPDDSHRYQWLSHEVGDSRTRSTKSGSGVSVLRLVKEYFWPGGDNASISNSVSSEGPAALVILPGVEVIF